MTLDLGWTRIDAGLYTSRFLGRIQGPVLHQRLTVQWKIEGGSGEWSVELRHANEPDTILLRLGPQQTLTGAKRAAADKTRELAESPLGKGD